MSLVSASSSCISAYCSDFSSLWRKGKVWSDPTVYVLRWNFGTKNPAAQESCRVLTGWGRAGVENGEEGNSQKLCWASTAFGSKHNHAPSKGAADSGKWRSQEGTSVKQIARAIGPLTCEWTKMAITYFPVNESPPAHETTTPFHLQNWYKI